MCCPSTIVPRLRQAGRPRRAAPTSSRRPTTAGRRRPRCRVNLKCFTALVTYSRSRWIPAAASALSSSLPAGPTNGAPALSCWSPLLADQQDVRGRRSRPEHRLVGVQIQVAALAALGGGGQVGQVVRVRDEVRRTLGCVVRLKSRAPNSRSRRCTCLLRAAWVTFSRSAARPKCRSSATAMKY